ncbi:major facilitator superfamily domain-containing protein [Xylariaceae sp. FL1272]|nr:major facilitator superfamily domain-containing protein [Xylariaceae sp. FL1272]
MSGVEDHRNGSGKHEPVTSPSEEDDTKIKDFAGEEKSHTDDDVDTASSITAQSSTSSSSDRIDQPRTRLSRSVSKAVSVSEIHDEFQNQRDPELGPPLHEKISTTAPDPNDPNLVTWTGPDDPENPKNWKYSKKWGAVFTVSLFTLISPVSSSLVAPALEKIGEELHISSAIERNLTLSIFILAYAVGPLVWGPMSELYGRVRVLQLVNLICNLTRHISDTSLLSGSPRPCRGNSRKVTNAAPLRLPDLFFNLGCGLARTRVQLIVFRFFSGLGGSVSLAVGGGVLGDLFVAEERGKALALYGLAPLLGPAIGPIAGAFISQNTTWRWAFYATTIADAAIQIGGLFFLKETYTPVLLQWKKQRLIKEMGNDGLHTPFDHPDRTVGKAIRLALERPMKMITTQIIVQCLALYMLYLYGLIYIVLVSFPSLWSTPKPEGYGESLGIGGLNYISLGLGFFVGTQVCAPLQDRIYASLKRKNGGPGRPEYRVPLMIPGALLVPIGLVIYGWTAEYKTHWIAPNIGTFLFSAGTIIGFQCLQSYLVDSYTRYAASAVSAGTVLRSLAGFGFPLFAPSLYDSLGYGWGNTLLAFVGIAIGWPGPFLLWKYGERLRKRSTFAAGGY